MIAPVPLAPPWDRKSKIANDNSLGPVCPVSARHTFSMAGWHVWCGSLVENSDGQFSLFFSCWPEEHGHDGWVTHSQIWRAVGPTPWGPFTRPHAVLTEHRQPSWDGDNFHNVTVKNFSNRYYLYYTGNHGNGEWWVHRNNQRIGVAVADAPEGPWKRSSKAVLDISLNSWDSLCVANPSITRTPDGRYMMIYKGVTAGDLPYGSQVLHGVAFADRPEGPFQKINQPFFEVPDSQFPFEDPHIWFAENRYQCLMKDMVGLPGSCPRATVLFESENGIDWDTNKYKLVATPHLEMPDGEVVKVEKLERPAYFLHPVSPCLSFAVKPEGNGTSFLVFAPGPLIGRTP